MRRGWEAGRRHGYPLCCVLHFVAAAPFGVLGQAVRRGGCREVRPDGSLKTWVPCHYHKGRHPAWRPSYWLRLKGTKNGLIPRYVIELGLEHEYMRHTWTSS